jgi:hypothetical protein
MRGSVMIETVWNDYVVLADENDTTFFSVYDSEGNEVEDLSYGEACEINDLLEKEKHDENA